MFLIEVGEKGEPAVVRSSSSGGRRHRIRTSIDNLMECEKDWADGGKEASPCKIIIKVWSMPQVRDTNGVQVQYDDFRCKDLLEPRGESWFLLVWVCKTT